MYSMRRVRCMCCMHALHALYVFYVGCIAPCVRCMRHTCGYAFYVYISIVLRSMCRMRCMNDPPLVLPLTAPFSPSPAHFFFCHIGPPHPPLSVVCAVWTLGKKNNAVVADPFLAADSEPTVPLHQGGQGVPAQLHQGLFHASNSVTGVVSVIRWRYSLAFFFCFSCVWAFFVILLCVCVYVRFDVFFFVWVWLASCAFSVFMCALYFNYYTR